MKKAIDFTLYLKFAFWAFVLYLVNSIVSNVKDIKNQTEKDEMDADDERDVIESQTTITKLQAQGIAESLWTAFEAWGTDEDLMYSELDKLQNKYDFGLVYNAFGFRAYSKVYGTGGNLINTPKFDLVAIMSNELNEAEKVVIAQRYAHLEIF